MGKTWNIAIVGATGTVGSQLIDCLEERGFPVGTLRLLSSGRSVGEILEFRAKPVPVEELQEDSFQDIHIAFFSAGSDCSRIFCPAATRAGAVCIDTSSAWRLDPGVPLVVPEVNPETIPLYTRKGIIASPGPAAIQMAVALKPLHDYANIKRIVVLTCEAVSATGKNGVDELEQQVKDLLQCKPPKVKVYPHQIAFNCLPQVDTFEESGYTLAETRLQNEIQKLLGAGLKITATAIRVPVFYGHSQSVNLQTEKKLTADTTREILGRASGCLVVDQTADRQYPMPVDAAGQDLVMVGRIREDNTVESGLNLWIVADNSRKGGATNAVQIAEILVGRYLN